MATASADLFESLAARTWMRLQLAEALRTSYGEETITDNIILDLLVAAPADVRVRPVPKPEEALHGADWEWWLGNDSDGWWPFAVQAKKLSKNRVYLGLRYTVKGVLQADLLERYARRRNAIPLYCFYNYDDGLTPGDCWNCPLPPDLSQLGCTVTALDVVKRVIPKRRPKTMRALHADRRSIPWRCLLKCPFLAPGSAIVGSHPLASVGFENVRPVANLPSYALGDGPVPAVTLDDDDASGITLVPRFVVVLNTARALVPASTDRPTLEA